MLLIFQASSFNIFIFPPLPPVILNELSLNSQKKVPLTRCITPLWSGVPCHGFAVSIFTGKIKDVDLTRTALVFSSRSVILSFLYHMPSWYRFLANVASENLSCGQISAHIFAPNLMKAIVYIFPNFQNFVHCEKDFNDNKQNSLHMLGYLLLDIICSEKTLRKLWPTR